ncbi:MAG: hypothetical protein ACK5MU_03130 [Candidatus Saccharimonadales bacterium]
MSRTCKKIAGLACLAFVVGVTVVASGMPPVQEASAAGSDVNVQFRVVDGQYLVQIQNPADGAISYSGETVTGKIHYDYAQTVNVWLVMPDGSEVLVTTLTTSGDPSEDHGDIVVDLPVSDFGSYTLKVSGTDLSGNQMPGSAIVFNYKAATVSSEDGSDKIKVEYGTGICKIGFQAYEITDTAKQNPLINPEHIIDVPQATNIPSTVEVSRSELGLGSGEYIIVINSYDCLNDTVVDSDETTISAMIEPPKTGAISILGITITQADYLVTGLIVFVLTAFFAMFLLGRRKKANRRR